MEKVGGGGQWCLPTVDEQPSAARQPKAASTVCPFKNNTPLSTSTSFLHLLPLLSLALTLTASAATMTWTGGGDDNLWSNGANWGGTAPGQSDTAVFDTGSDAVSVDVAQVQVLIMGENFTGSLTMANDFIVRDGHYQTNGTFNCASFLYTVGLGTDGASGPTYRGFFNLIGGTFNCSTGITRWRPTNNGPVFRIDKAATWNHCGGTFQMGGPNNGNASFEVNGETFKDFAIYGSRQGMLVGRTTNIVAGTYTSHGSGLRSGGISQSSQIGDPAKWDSDGSGRNATLAIHGDVYVDDSEASNGRSGNAVLLLCGDSDQVIHSDNGYLPTVVIDKPVGTKVTCDIPDDQKLTFFGMGSGMNPHLFVKSGKFVFPKGGVSFPNARYTDIFVTGDGDIDTSGAGLFLQIINGAFICMPNHKLGNLRIGGGPITGSTVDSICITGNLELVSGGYFAPGNGTSVPTLCGEGDQHFKGVDGAHAVLGAGSTWAGYIIFDKPSGRLIMDTPLLSHYISFARDTHLVFPVTNAIGAAAAEIGNGGWNTPLFTADKVASTTILNFPKNGTITLEPQGDFTVRSPTKWNLFRYTQKVGNADSVTFRYVLPERLCRPKVHHDTANKLIYLAYVLRHGLMVIVR